MKTNRTLIAMCIATIFASGSLCAKDKWEYHTDGWEKTKSYGNVMVANDTAKQWGPWEDFVEPAAGAPSIAFIGAGADDPYKIIPNPIPVPEGCAAGEWCGYMAYSVKNKYEYTDWSYEKVRVRNESGYGYHYEWQWVPHTETYTTRTDLQPAEMRLQFVQPGVGDDWKGYGEVSFLSELAEFNAAVGTDAQEIGVKFDWQQGDFQSYNPWDNVVLEGLADSWWPWYYYFDSSDSKWKDIRKYATMGLLEVKLENDVAAYVSSSCEGDCAVLKETKVYVPYVAGQVTALAEMAGLSMSSATASYFGRSFGGGTVGMQVSFAGTGSWSGEWRGGYLPNFNASGGISGASFASSSVTGVGCGGAVTGTVVGSFYGPQAAAAGGVADVTKNATRYVDVFLATKQPN